MNRRIEPATVAFGADGQPFSPRYGDVYASRDGALGQARHVFLAGNDLPARWAGRDKFVIVETGFGLGVNFLATWHAWRDDPARARRLHFVSVELHPVDAAALREAAPPALAALADELAACWPLPLPGLHRLEFACGAVVLTLAFGDARSTVPQLALGADAFFLDGFAPARNPALWEPGLIKALARLARPGATAATWCSASAVREALAASGFEVALRAGFGRKRDMLTARYAPRFTTRRHEPPPPWHGERRAVVLGAGLAGCASAAALGARGWRVEVIERDIAAAAGASALPAGLMHPLVAADDSVLARLTRAGFLLGRRRLAAAAAAAQVWWPTGVLQQARAEREVVAWRRALAALGTPAAYVDCVDAAEGAARVGLAVRRGGLWFAQGGVVAPARWCQHMLGSAPVPIALRTRAQAVEVVPGAGLWRVVDGAGQVLAEAPVLVVATALQAPPLLGLRHAPVRAVRGRVSMLSGGDLPGLRAGLTGDGYLVRGPDGRVGVGASYEWQDAATSMDAVGDLAEVHAGNLQRMGRLLADPPKVRATGVFDGVRCVARDRLPLVGAVADESVALAAAATLRGAHPADLPRRSGLYSTFAFGSRGLTLAALAAELIAAQIEGEPWPIERDLAAAIDPARFLLQHLRRGR